VANVEETLLNHERHPLQENVNVVQKGRRTETAFTHQGITVHLTFAEKGSSLDELLTNYFKNLKQG